jgi:transposase
MPELPDPRSLSPESLELLRLLVVRAVIDLDMSQVEAATYYGVSPHTISEWVSRYREQGEDALAVKTQGRPRGAGCALSPEQEDEIRTLVVDSTPLPITIRLTKPRQWRRGSRDANRRSNCTGCRDIPWHLTRTNFSTTISKGRCRNRVRRKASK